LVLAAGVKSCLYLFICRLCLLFKVQLIFSVFSKWKRLFFL
jgi:hypothetical protein